MLYNKVVLNDKTLLDVSQDTATEEDVAEGKTFHTADGAQAVGTGKLGGGLQGTLTELTAVANGEYLPGHAPAPGDVIELKRDLTDFDFGQFRGLPYDDAMLSHVIMADFETGCSSYLGMHYADEFIPFDCLLSISTDGMYFAYVLENTVNVPTGWVDASEFKPTSFSVVIATSTNANAYHVPFSVLYPLFSESPLVPRDTDLVPKSDIDNSLVAEAIGTDMIYLGYPTGGTFTEVSSWHRASDNISIGLYISESIDYSQGVAHLYVYDTQDSEFESTGWYVATELDEDYNPIWTSCKTPKFTLCIPTLTYNADEGEYSLFFEGCYSQTLLAHFFKTKEDIVGFSKVNVDVQSTQPSLRVGQTSCDYGHGTEGSYNIRKVSDIRDLIPIVPKKTFTKPLIHPAPTSQFVLKGATIQNDDYTTCSSSSLMYDAEYNNNIVPTYVSLTHTVYGKMDYALIYSDGTWHREDDSGSYPVIISDYVFEIDLVLSCYVGMGMLDRSYRYDYYLFEEFLRGIFDNTVDVVDVFSSPKADSLYVRESQYGTYIYAGPGRCFNEVHVQYPSGLWPENIKKGVTIVDVTGTFVGTAYSKNADFSNGDQVITNDDKSAMSQVTVKKPSTLIPKNILKGVTVAGVTGTLETGVFPTGTREITLNGEYDVTLFERVNVNIPAESGLFASWIQGDVAEVTEEMLTGVTAISKYAFYNNTSLTAMALPDSVTSIGANAFENCTSLTSIAIGNGVKSISTSAFKACNALKRVIIGNGVTSISSSAFADCTALEEIYFNATAMGNLSSSNYVFRSAGKNGDGINVVIGKNVTKIPNYLFYPHSTESYSPKITDVEFEEGSVCESIGNYAFYRCTNLTGVTIPDRVTSIGSYAFCNCTGLTSVIIPNSVLRINSSAFNNCDGLTSVIIPDSVTEISDNVFYGCQGLTSVTIGNGVTSIYSSSFNGCTNLTSVYITDIAKWCKILFKTLDANPLVYAKNLYLNGNLVTELTIPDGVTSIDDYAFYNCTSLTSVSIGNRVTAINYAVFRGCTSLTSVTIGDNVTKIGNDAFYGCTNLTSIIIPASITSIGSSAFRDCTNLTIYCEAESQPSGWNSNWNYSDCPVVWGYTKNEEV